VIALAWARLWRAEVRYDAARRLFVATGMRSGFARGGTTVGGVYLSRQDPGPARLRHEAVHAAQWARHGLTFPVRYWLEELRRRRSANRFEIEAGLADGGYPVTAGRGSGCGCGRPGRGRRRGPRR
jgi:hypothetical protein